MTDETETRERPDYEVAKDELAALMAALGLSFAFTFVPLSKVSKERRKSWSHDGKPSRFLTWKCRLHRGTVPGEPTGPVILETEYSAGSGHCPSSTNAYPTPIPEARKIAWECEHGKPAGQHHFDGASREWVVHPKPRAAPILPDPVDVFASLVNDSDALDHPTFESWAGDLGYDPDSRKGEAIYRACLKTALQLRAALGDETLQKAREIAGRL